MSTQKLTRSLLMKKGAHVYARLELDERLDKYLMSLLVDTYYQKKNSS